MMTLELTLNQRNFHPMESLVLLALTQYSEHQLPLQLQLISKVRLNSNQWQLNHYHSNLFSIKSKIQLLFLNPFQNMVALPMKTSSGQNKRSFWLTIDSRHLLTLEIKKWPKSQLEPER